MRRHPVARVVRVPRAGGQIRLHQAVEGSDPSVDELAEHARQHIAGYKVPRSYELRTEPLPLSGVGKVQKNKLRDEWLARQETSQ